MNSSTTLKIFSDSYLYGEAKYEREIFNYLMSSDTIDKESDAFSDILYQVKTRQTNPVILKVLMSSKVVLMLANKPMPRSFKVLRAVDVKRNQSNSKDRKIFIDCTDLIKMDGGVYKCKNIGVFMSYLISAMTYVLYYERPDAIVRNSTLTESGTNAFVDLMLYALGYLKVPVSFGDNKEQMSYALATYYQRCILCKNEESVWQMAKKVSKLDPKKCDYLRTILSLFYDEARFNGKFCTINDFVIKFAKIFMDQDETSKDPNRLTTDALVQRWMYAYGPGTYIGLEVFPPFAAMITDCYVGAYVNQQNTIEKIVGRSLAEFTNALIAIGSDNA